LLDQLVTLAEGENISRTALEASVMRILKLKQRMFPDAVALQDLDETVHNMSLRQLWAQKLIYPVWTPAHTRQFVQEGVGGVSFEGIASNEVYRRTIQTELEANPDLIPPFLANNSPQEKTERHSSSNPAFLAEKQQLKSIAALCENIFPLGFPPEVANALILASQGQ
jgi:hypothetical protein